MEDSVGVGVGLTAKNGTVSENGGEAEERSDGRLSTAVGETETDGVNVRRAKLEKVLRDPESGHLEES